MEKKKNNAYLTSFLITSGDSPRLDVASFITVKIYLYRRAKLLGKRVQNTSSKNRNQCRRFPCRHTRTRKRITVDPVNGTLTSLDARARRLYKDQPLIPQERNQSSKQTIREYLRHPALHESNDWNTRSRPQRTTVDGY